MDHLLLKYLKEKLTLEEQHNLSKWLEEDPVNKKVLDKLEVFCNTRKPDLNAQREEVLKGIKHRIKRDSQAVKKSRSFSTWRYFKYAAVLLFLFIFSYFLYNYPSKVTPVEQVRYIEKNSLPGQKISLKLPDGSLVKLNTDSKLIVPEKFDANLRQVELQGEAFFDIVPNASCPFQVKMKGMVVIVKGTSFNVRAYEDEKDKTVAVKSGLVSVIDHGGDKTLELAPNEMSILSMEKGSFEKFQIKNENLIFGWTNKSIVFENQTLSEVLYVISRWYGIEVKMEDALISGKVDSSGKFYTANHDNNPSLQEIMKTVSFVFEINYEIINDKLIIKKKES